jgi:hypothetical protein
MRVLPIFVPNDYMYNTYSNLGKEKSEIYLKVMREIIADATGLPKND